MELEPIIISSSILSANFAKLGEQIAALEQAGVDWIHIDVMDGHFVPNITMGQFIVETCRAITSLPLDVHLMITNPEDHIPSFIKSGANWVSVQVETCPNIYRTLEYIRSLGAHPGVVINPGTPASALQEILHLVDMVLVMTVNPGYSGQTFIPEVLPKIKQLSAMLMGNPNQAKIQVDGGITPATLPLVYQAGARIIVAATSIFKHPAGIAAGVSSLRNAIPALK